MFLSLLIYVKTFAQTVGAAGSLYSLSPQASIIDGISYPRNGLTLYRGTSDQQMDLNKAIRAMLGDPSVYVESLFFSTIKNKLMQQSFSHAIPISGFLDDRIQTILKQKGRSLDEAEAASETQKLVDGTFDYLSSRNFLVPQYLDYQSPTYNDYPQDVVFTTVVSPVAATYGNRMLVIREKQNRSLDLNYWNKINRGLWSVYTRDAGEFITFGYMKPEDIVGYQLRSGPDKSWHSIELGFYKVISQNKPAILVFSGKTQDGESLSCLDFDQKQNTVFKCGYRRGQVVLQPPPITKEKPSIIGVIVLCDSRGDCDPVPKSEVQKYSVTDSGSRLPQLVNLTVRVQNKSVRFVPLAH